VASRLAGRRAPPRRPAADRPARRAERHRPCNIFDVEGSRAGEAREAISRFILEKEANMKARPAPIGASAAFVQRPAAACLLRVPAILLALAGLVLVPVTAHAQSPVGEVAAVTGQELQNGNGYGRAELWAARRAEKRASLQPAEPTSGSPILGVVAMVAGRVGHVERAGEGLSLVVGGKESGSGIQGGVQWRDMALGRGDLTGGGANRADLTLRAIASLSGYSGAMAELALLELGGLPVNVAVRGAHERRADDAFFGIGPETVKDDETVFALRGSEAGLDAWWSGIEGLRVGAGLGVLGFDQRLSPQADNRSIEDAFSPAEAPGLGAEPTLARLIAFVEYDRRDARDYPRDGSYWRLSLADHRELDGDRFGFRRLRAETHHYFPFVKPRRVIAIRALADLTDAHDGRLVPFWLQPSLGGGEDMRGLSTFRFRAPHKLLVQTEYRWEAWVGLDMALFFDAGQVFADRGELSLGNLQTSYGVGFRFKLQESMLLRFDIGYGSGGLKPDLSFNRIF
jgi:hypothetical protein